MVVSNPFRIPPQARMIAALPAGFQGIVMPMWPISFAARVALRIWSSSWKRRGKQMLGQHSKVAMCSTCWWLWEKNFTSKYGKSSTQNPYSADSWHFCWILGGPAILSMVPPFKATWFAATWKTNLWGEESQSGETAVEPHGSWISMTQDVSFWVCVSWNQSPNFSIFVICFIIHVSLRFVWWHPIVFFFQNNWVFCG